MNRVHELAKPTLGMGAYSLSDAARYTRTSPSTIRAWFQGRSDGTGRGPVLMSDYRPVHGDRTVSFLDLIDAHVAGQFRKTGVKMSIIRRAYELMSESMSTKHPFAVSDLYTDGERIITRAADDMGEESLHDVISQQRFFEHIRDLLEHIDYDDISKMASRWRIHDGIVIDPSVSLGRPVVSDTGVHTRVLANQYYANQQDASVVSELYGVTEMDVMRALEFEDQLGQRGAA